MNGWLLVAMAVGIAVGAALVWMLLQRQQRTQAAGGDAMRDTFRALAAETLNSNNEQFLRLAEENLKKFQHQARSELEQKEKSIETLVKPIGDALKRTSEQIEALEKERRQTHGSISQYLQNMQETQQSLQTETRNLVNALRKPEVRGRYGEMSLRRLAELAGMIEHCDFTEQETTADGMRPDMIVKMPDDRQLVIDAKTPISAYLDALEAPDDASRDAHLLRHVRHIRDQVQKLSAKAYWSQFKQSPDFVVMFLPGEQFLEPALKLAPDLHEEALRQKVVLATPTSLVALLKVVAYGWRQQRLAENAEEICRHGEELHRRLATFAEHLDKLGRSLGSSVETYNKAVGSFERQVIPGARRFPEMGVRSGKDIPQLDPIEKLPRDVTSAGDDEPGAG
ncbi:MAG: DNA recombination protein RmuC [Gammaproteobacteria bacterium]